MHESLENLCEALDGLATKVLAAWNDNRTLNTVHGWNHPALTRQDLAAVASKLADKIRAADLDEIGDDKLVDALDRLPSQLAQLHPTTIPHLFNGHGVQAVPAYLGTIEYIDRTLDSVLVNESWQTIQDNKAMPAALARRLRGLQAEFDTLLPNKDSLVAQIKLIQDATVAAELLPSDLLYLKDTRNAIASIHSEAAGLYGKIDDKHKDSVTLAKQIADSENEAAKLVLRCEDAYRITTTKGLSAAFDERARDLTNSMGIWVAGLLLALGFGAYLGAQRIELLSKAMSVDPNFGIIMLQLALSLLSVGAPLWFAWLATKQIGQRFKLAEDYGFKASVAKAYEGYRKEAARIDPALEARLFASALTRLEEPPLRFVGNTEHGSPMHEFANSDALQKAIDFIPGFRDKFIAAAEKLGLSGAKKVSIKQNEQLDGEEK